MHIHIAGLGKYLPPKCVSSIELDKQLGLALGSTEQQSGVAMRYYADAMSASAMAVQAINAALTDAKLKLTDIDCLIAASGTMEQAIPCNAARILSHLDSEHIIPAFDINMTCLSSMMAIDVASQMLHAGSYQRILIVASDIASVGLNYENIKVAGNFGDGASAIILTRPIRQTQKILASQFATYPAGVEHCQIPGAGTLNHPSKITDNYGALCQFQMDGKSVYKLALSTLPSFVKTLLAKANLHINDIDWLVPHQASPAALRLLPRNLKINKNKMINIIHDHGNQISASLLTALYTLKQQGIKAGEKIMLLGTGAGLSIGGIIIEY